MVPADLDDTLAGLDEALPEGLDDTLLDVARRAGEEIMAVYEASQGIEIDRKADDSPLTQADLASHRVIAEALSGATPGIPVLSEESRQVAFEERDRWDRFWLVDPLDGTKEFIKRNGEFTVNIALVVGHRPIAGIVHAPDLEATYLGRLDEGAVLLDEARGTQRALETLAPGEGEPVGVVVSRSHLNEATEAFVEQLGRPTELVRSGSSLKFCRIAEGSAHLYPRLAPTMEWDTAAAQAVLEAAGGLVIQADGPQAGQPLVYNKQDLLNPHFIAAADASLIPEAYR